MNALLPDKKKHQIADLQIATVGLFWGASTVVAKHVLSTLPPFAFMSARFWLAFLVIFILYFPRMRNISRETISLGITTGLLLFASYALQLVGMLYTSVANAAFIAALGVIIIPIIHAVMVKRLPSGPVITSIILCTIGLALLTGWQGGFNLGDFLCLLCAVTFSFYTIVIDRKAGNIESLSLTAVQFATAGICATIAAFFFETYTASQLIESWGSILFVGILCTALVTPLQIIGQKNTTPTRVGVILLLEPVSATILAFLFLNEFIGIPGFIGSCLILTGILIAELRRI